MSHPARFRGTDVDQHPEAGHRRPAPAQRQTGLQSLSVDPSLEAAQWRRDFRAGRERRSRPATARSDPLGHQRQQCPHRGTRRRRRRLERAEKVWSGGTSAAVAVTEDPEPGSALPSLPAGQARPGRGIRRCVLFARSRALPRLSGKGGTRWQCTCRSITVRRTRSGSRNAKAGVVELGCTYTQGY